MCPKLALLAAILLLFQVGHQSQHHFPLPHIPHFQCTEAKKRPNNSITLSTFVEDLRDVLQAAWDALIDLVPAAPQAKHQKKKTSSGWGVNDYVKSATKKFNRFYKSLGRAKQHAKDLNGDEVFTVELFAAEVVERATWGLINIVDSFGQNDSS